MAESQKMMRERAKLGEHTGNGQSERNEEREAKVRG